MKKQNKPDSTSNAPATAETVTPQPPANRIYKELYFPTSIYFQDLPAAEALNAALRGHVRRWKQADREGIVRSNVKATGSWHSADDLNQRVECRELLARISEACNGIFTDHGYDPAFDPVCDNMWAIVNPRGGFNRFHTHPNSLWSGVYYVQTPPNCGRVYFIDPRPQTGVISARYNKNAPVNRENWREVYYEPKEGRMILFPAWLGHEVEPNLTATRGRKGERICIAFNISQRKRAAAS